MSKSRNLCSQSVTFHICPKVNTGLRKHGPPSVVFQAIIQLARLVIISIYRGQICVFFVAFAVIDNKEVVQTIQTVQQGDLQGPRWPH